MKRENPFIVGGYISPEYFCDRREETRKIINAINNGRNLTLISLRRIGKTGLIHNAYHHLKTKKNIKTVYIDLMTMQSVQKFTEVFASAVITAIEPLHEKIIKKIGQFITNLRPIITFDINTGQPSLELKMLDPARIHPTIIEIFEYIKNQNKIIVIALDEFQQAANFGSKNLIPLIRSNIQSTSNARFIFSGSSKQMLINMFSHPSGIFFRSTDILLLESINENEYKNFIIQKLALGKYKISEDALNLIFTLTRGHTFYIQYLCNRLYERNVRLIDAKQVTGTLNNILDENEQVFYSYKNLMAEHQWLLLTAISKHGKIDMPTSKEFINKYDLSAASTVSTALSSLMDKEMVYEENGYYYVYDVFLSEWLKRL